MENLSAETVRITNLFTDVLEERAAIAFKLEAEDSILHGEVFYCSAITART
jgi:hypothetical protein